jgi:NAD-dependent deacetylase
MSVVPTKDETRCVDILRDSRDIVVFSGAGVSAESGIPTFRDADGLWSRFPPEEFANWAGIVKLIYTDPLRIAKFLIALLEPIVAAQPNPAHLAIVSLEKVRTVTVLTQNIDRLHQRAGSNGVVELHGSLFEIGHIGSTRVEEISTEVLARILHDLKGTCMQRASTKELLRAISPIAGLSISGGNRPNVVLFGEDLPKEAWDRACHAATSCDCMLVVGCSQIVAPAASLPRPHDR